MMPAWLYTGDENSAWIFLLVTVLLGGSTAYLSGKAIAETWRPLWHLPVYMLMTALAVRFLHYALFHEVFFLFDDVAQFLLSLRNYIVDLAVLLVAGLAGYLVARRRQMAAQYGWRRTS
jgi:hypothetical protein